MVTQHDAFQRMGVLMAARLVGKARSWGMVHDFSWGVCSDNPRVAFIVCFVFSRWPDRHGMMVMGVVEWIDGDGLYAAFDEVLGPISLQATGMHAQLRSLLCC